MVIQEEKKGDALTVKPEGRLDTLSSPELDRFLQERYSSAWQIILDLEKVEYISSAGLRVVIQTHKAMKAKGGLLVSNACPAVMEVFIATGFVHVLKFTEEQKQTDE